VKAHGEREKVPSPRPCKPRATRPCSSCFQEVGLEGGFFRTQIPEAKNDLDTTCCRGGAEKTDEKGGSKRPETYTGGSGNTIP
jgi:hypothetical protein